ncbi:helix-turn-helix transcriptional regulator [Asticcacaulis excentricus]|uniref:helix-turn-helix transcriptional regulator n=1 Tax=Asticcacaulis excentricus TaxID=78587 RepID=UPI0015628305|nr:helix-turn-helix domain-containing protein [Asticcacaulis excentricus]
MNNETITSQYLNAKQAARFTNLSTQSLYKFDKQGKGPIKIKVGGRVLFDKNDLTAWMDAQKIKH